MRYSLELTSGPAVEPDTTAEAKEEMRIDFSDHDTKIGTLITAARRWAEDYTRRAFITQTWVQRMDYFPNNLIELAKPPVQSVTSIQYIDTDGDTQTWAASSYIVDTKAIRCRITPEWGDWWPSERDIMNAVIITFVSGYGAAASNVPEEIRQAILMLVSHWYDHSGIVSDRQMHNIPLAAERLLHPFRVEA